MKKSHQKMAARVFHTNDVKVTVRTLPDGSPQLTVQQHMPLGYEMPPLIGYEINVSNRRTLIAITRALDRVLR